MTIGLTVNRHSHVFGLGLRGSAGTMLLEELGDHGTGRRDFGRKHDVYAPGRHRCSKICPHRRMSGTYDLADDSRIRENGAPTCSNIPFFFTCDVILV